jgi:conjugative transfer signal peptidase TraF
VKPFILPTLGALGVAAALAPIALNPPPALLWNATASAPTGLYGLASVGRIAVGDWVAVRAPADFAELFAARRYVPLGIPLVKRVAALPPSTVCRNGDQIAIDGRAAARARSSDRFGRSLPAWRGCRRLGSDQVFLLNAAPDSLDGRYFGPVSMTSLIGRLTPLWTQGSAPR